ncbi:MAG: hypothetical protein ABIH00_01960 [Armatimonadota bacterium]
MKKYGILTLVILIIFAFTVGVCFSEEVAANTENDAGKNNLLENCVKNISKVQTLIEYYYLQSGIYPESLDQLYKSYNVSPDETAEVKNKIEIPKDPASGKDFVYKIDEGETSNYHLMVPDPKLYGVPKLELSALNWGWMSTYAGEERRKMGISICVDLLKRLATDVELYAQQNDGKFPENIDILIKEKYDSPEVFSCPVCKAKYVYELKDDTYIIKCPDPNKHKLKQLEYDYLKGVVGK